MNKLFSFPFTSKFYLQSDLIISPFWSGLGVPYSSLNHPPEVFYKKAARSYCLHKLLFLAGTLLFGEVTVYVHAVPCRQLQSYTVTQLLGQRLWIAPMPCVPFTLVPGTCTSARPVGWGYFPYPPQSARYRLLPLFNLFDLQIRNWPVQSAYLSSSKRLG